MRLLIDLGNSRMKWAVSAPGLWQSEARGLPQTELAAWFDEIWGGTQRPERAVVSSVLDARHTRMLQEWMQRRWSLTPHVVRAQAQLLGVTNRYRDPRSLGADRWAALIAARHGYRGPLCVVDCGSAVTVDALSEQGDFLGGAIFPGLELVRRALFTGTAGVRAAAAAGDDGSCFARATADGVAAGSLYGLAGAIERILDEQRRVLGPGVRVVITGGDAPVVAARLRVPTIPDPDLVLKGLELIAGELT